MIEEARAQANPPRAAETREPARETSTTPEPARHVRDASALEHRASAPPPAVGLGGDPKPPVTPAAAEAGVAAAGPRLASVPPAEPIGSNPAQAARPRGGYQVLPTYPATPRRLGIEGTTLLRVLVLDDGRVGDIQIQQSAGHPDLDRTAAEAVRRWRFDPARKEGKAVSIWVLLPVQFRLTD